MAIAVENVIENLDKEDKEKVSYFIRLLLKQAKYRQLKEEIASRRDEIQRGETLTHDEIWDKFLPKREPTTD